MKWFLKAFVAAHVWLYHSTAGRLGSTMRGGRLLLLTTTGRKTGKARTVPVMYTEDPHGNPVVCASAAGAPAHPAWFTNLAANPDVTVEVPGRSFPARAVVTAGEEREALWRELTARHPGFLEYTRKTDRAFPMVVLKPAA